MRSCCHPPQRPSPRFDPKEAAVGRVFRMTPERRLLRSAVAEVDDAVAECARLEELEVDTSVFCEEGFASAESHGVDEQVVLVDELVRCESRGELCAANGDRPTVLFLERLDRLHGIAAGEARVSLDCLERLREDELR